MNIKLSGFADEIDASLAAQISGLKGLGMGYVEMRGVDGQNLISHTDEKVKDIKKILDSEGIKLSALGSPLGKIGIDDDFAPHMEAFKRAIEIAHMMECPNIRMFSFYLPEGCNPEDYEGRVFDRINSFVEYASANEAVLLHENEKGIYGAKAKECKKLMENFYGDHFKAVFDFANFVQCHQDTLEAYEMLKQYVHYIHVKDAKWADGSVVPVGYGDGNVAKILQQLFASGYNGFLSLEPHLAEFGGFSALEITGVSLCKEKAKPLSGLEAFTLAHDSLMKVLEEIKVI